MKKLLSLALISAMLLTFTACDKKENSSDTSTENSQSSQTSKSESTSTSSEPVSTTGSGWTMESLAKTICINGKAISNPFTIDSLGTDYSLDEHSNLIHDGSAVATIRLDNESTETDDRLKKIRLINAVDNGQTLKELSINGITIGSTLAEAESKLGKPSVETSSGGNDLIWVYFEDGKTEDENFLVLNFSNEKVFMMTFRFQ